MNHTPKTDAKRREIRELKEELRKVDHRKKYTTISGAKFIELDRRCNQLQTRINRLEGHTR